LTTFWTLVLVVWLGSPQQTEIRVQERLPDFASCFSAAMLEMLEPRFTGMPFEARCDAEPGQQVSLEQLR